jgi:hypothetical protein
MPKDTSGKSRLRDTGEKQYSYPSQSTESGGHYHRRALSMAEYAEQQRIAEGRPSPQQQMEEMMGQLSAATEQLGTSSSFPVELPQASQGIQPPYSHEHLQPRQLQPFSAYPGTSTSSTQQASGFRENSPQEVPQEFSSPHGPGRATESRDQIGSFQEIKTAFLDKILQEGKVFLTKLQHNLQNKDKHNVDRKEAVRLIQNIIQVKYGKTQKYTLYQRSDYSIGTPEDNAIKLIGSMNNIIAKAGSNIESATKKLNRWAEEVGLPQNQS